MSIGIALLVHQDLGRAGELVQALHAAGFKLAIHVDAKVATQEYDAFYQSGKGLDNAVLVPRIDCEWGRFSLVEAQISTAETLLARFPDVSHVMQISGSCLPNRPLAELQAFLASQPACDFIESVMVGGVNWTKGGLEAERFEQYFPISFMKHRRLFDALVAVQRKLGIKRKMPAGLVPHIGSQWWALSRATLQAIINDPERAAYDRYFSRCWIPDESYFQTLARKHGRHIKARSLTYSRFDFRGRPMIFYDDHSRFVEHLDSYFIRKVWAGADRLYKTLLAPDRRATPPNPDMAVAFDAEVSKAESRWLKGRAGLEMQSRAPRPSHDNTAAPYTVLSGFDRVFNGLTPWIQQQTGIVLFEHLFSTNQKRFAATASQLKGNLGGSRKIRDHNPQGFLRNFVWNHSDDDPIFNFDPATNPELAKYIANDPNARIFHIRSSWLLDLLRSDQRDVARLKPLVQAHTLKEHAQLQALTKGRAKVQIISLNDIFTQPGAVLEDLVLALRPGPSPENREIPPFLPHDGLEEYVEFLKDAGLNLQVEAVHGFNFAGPET